MVRKSILRDLAMRHDKSQLRRVQRRRVDKTYDNVYGPSIVLMSTVLMFIVLKYNARK